MLSEPLRVTRTGNVTNVSLSGSASLPVLPPNTATNSMVAVFVVREGVTTAAENGVAVSHTNMGVSVKPTDNPNAGSDGAGRILNSFVFRMQSGGQVLKFNAQVGEAGVIVTPVGPSAAALIDSQRNSVVGAALVSSRQLNVPLDQIKAIFFDM